MAIIGRIRKHSSLAVIIIGIAIAAFVLSDLFKGGRGQRPPIGVIDGEDIPIEEYNRRTDDNIEIQKMNSQTEMLSAQEAFNIRMSTWNQLIEEYIMGQEYESLDLVVTTDELFDQVQSENPHRLIKQYFVDPNTKVYRRENVLQFLQNLDQMDATTRKQWLNLEHFIKKDRLFIKYQNLVSKGYYVPDAFAQMDYESKRKTAEIRYAGINYTTVSDSLVTVTDKDYEKYYNDHKYQYTQNASRDIDFVVFNVLPSEEDRETIRKNFYQLYDEYLTIKDVPAFVNAVSDNRYDSTFFTEGQLPVQIDSVMFNSAIGTFAPPYIENEFWHMAKLMDVQYRPDSMKADHILIAYSGAFQASQDLRRTKEMAKTLADSLLGLVKRDRSKMEALVVDFSDDPSARQNNGDLGWFADGTMAWSFNEAVVRSNINDVMVVETVFGYHVIKVTGKKDPVKKVRIAMVDRAIEPSSKTFQDIYLEASRFGGENNNLEKYDQACIDKGLNKRSAPNLQVTANTIPGIDNAREIVRWAFYEGIEQGEVSPVFDVEKRYVVAALKAIREKGDIPLDQIKDNLTSFVYNDKKAEYITERLSIAQGNLYKAASEFSATVDTNNSLTFSSRNIPGYGSEYLVIGSIFSTEPGTKMNILKGNGGVFAVTLDKLNDPAPTTNLSLYQNQMKSSFKSRVTSNYMFTALQEKAKIEDNRLFYF